MFSTGQIVDSFYLMDRNVHLDITIFYRHASFLSSWLKFYNPHQSDKRWEVQEQSTRAWVSCGGLTICWVWCSGSFSSSPLGKSLSTWVVHNHLPSWEEPEAAKGRRVGVKMDEWVGMLLLASLFTCSLAHLPALPPPGSFLGCTWPLPPSSEVYVEQGVCTEYQGLYQRCWTATCDPWVKAVCTVHPGIKDYLQQQPPSSISSLHTLIKP